ncbi:MAG: PAS domain-containing sensor histidine kinase [Gammaproteobacteria bacterium]|nr:MAG: PAS domain-containing sensor histidine kinase [Gammaproteobacteria bacterium]
MGVMIVDPELRLELWNRFMAMHSCRTEEDVQGRVLFDVFPDLPEKWFRQKVRSVLELQTLAFTSWVQRPHVFDFAGSRPITGKQSKMYQDTTFFPILEHGNVTHVGILIADATERAVQHQIMHDLNQRLSQEKVEQQHLIEKLEEAQNQLLQSEKMAAIGQLAAGVAHEINNPIGYVYSNIGSLERSAQDLLDMVRAWREAVEASGAPELVEKLDDLAKKYDFDFIQEDLSDLIAESREGAERVKRIVQDLKDFSHVDKAEWQLADLHKGLDSTLNVVWNEVKYKAEVIKEYGNLPEVECIASQLNQVFMNLIVNAAHAIEERGTITIRTGCKGDEVFVSVSDTGCGIPEQNLTKLFEPFFTTKPVGKGTGLGLSLSYSIVQRHQGRIEVESEVGRGTTFTVWLPIRQPEKQVDE